MVKNTSFFRIFLFLLIASILVHLPVLISGYPQGHDASYHLKWLYNFSSQLHSGDWYPRWLMGMSGGLGGPSFYYYPPAAYYLMAAIALIIDPYHYGHYVLACGAVVVALIGAMGTYLFCRAYLEKSYALFVALLFLVMPYRILIDLYMRGDLAELASISVLPFLFLISKHCGNAYRWVFLVTATSTALIVLTHPLVAMIILPFSALFRLLDAWRSDDRVVALLTYGSAILLGLGLSCFYILPAVAVFNPASAGWDLFVVYDSFLFHRPMSASRMSAMLGLASILISVALAVVGWGLLVWKRDNKSIGGFFLLSALICSGMLFEFSEPVYRLFFLLERLQFPWRYATALTLFACLAVGFLYSWASQQPQARGKKILVMGIRGLLAAFCLMALLVGGLRHGNSFTADKNTASIDIGLDAPEYRLSTLAKNLPETMDKVIGLPDSDYRVEIWDENRIRLSGTFPSGSEFSLARQYFGEWKVVSADGLADMDVENIDGLVRVKLHKGLDVIDIQRQEFAEVILGNRLSLAALILLVAGFLGLSFVRKSISYRHPV